MTHPLKLFVLVVCVLGVDRVSAEAISVDVYYPESDQNRQVLQLSGTVEAAQNADLAALQAGLIDTLYVEVGDKVQKGQKLMELDATLAKLSLSQAQAGLEAATVSREEAERLYREVIALSKQQVVAQTLIAERRAALASAQAELARQNATLALQQEIVRRHTLYAPFSGMIATRNADIGEWVTQQTRVFTLVEQGALRLSVAVPQEYYQQLTGQSDVTAQVQPDIVDALPVSATLSRLVAVSDNSSRTLVAHIDLPANANLVVGMSATAAISLPEGQQPLVWLPRSAVKLHPDGGSSVFAVVNNKAKRVLVKVVDRREDLVAVTQASADLAYVVTGIELLREGSELQVGKILGQMQ